MIGDIIVGLIGGGSMDSSHRRSVETGVGFFSPISSAVTGAVILLLMVRLGKAGQNGTTNLSCFCG